jgi:hypothetical protein
MWSKWYALSETTRARLTKQYGGQFNAAYALFGGSE